MIATMTTTKPKSINFSSLKFLSEQVSLFTHLNTSAWKTYRPFKTFEFEKGAYRVKIADTPRELYQVFNLRFQIFLREKAEYRIPLGLDFDRYDFKGDHLIIVQKSTGKIVGTYRLFSSHRTNDFFSSTQFDLAEIKKLPGVKLELGRACIHKDHRTGSVLHLLWMGLGRYIRCTQSQYLFGCSSIPDENPELTQSVWEALKNTGQVTEQYGVKSLIPLRTQLKPLYAHHLKTVIPSTHLPPLLMSYLKAGAKVAGEPFWDTKLKCIDFFTVLKLTEINPDYDRKYFRATEIKLNEMV